MRNASRCTIVLAAMAAGLFLAEAGCAEGGESTAPVGATSSSGSGGVGGGSMACTPEASRPCYEGPDGSEGVGICAGGQEVCAADGSAWGACEDQLLPGDEDCATVGDENCDGIACSDYLWQLVVPGSGLDRVTGLAFDGEGNVVVAGVFSGTHDFGGGPLTATQTSDVFVAKFDAAGQHVWSKKFAQTGYASPPLVAVDSNDNIVLVGYLEDSITFGFVPVNASQTGDDIYLAKLDGNGDHVWSQHLANQGGQVTPVGNKLPVALTIDDADGILVGGYYTGHWGCAVPINCTSVDGEAGFVRRYDAAGTIRWARLMENTGDQRVSSVSINSNDDIVISGSFQTGISFGNGQALTQTSGNPVEGFVARLDSTGAGQWAHAFGSSGGAEQHPQAVAWTSDSEFVVAGFFSGGITLDAAKTSNGNSDAFLAAFDVGTGMLSWSHSYGGPGRDAFRVLSVDDSGKLSLVGDFDGQIDVGSGTLDPTGDQNAIVAKLEPTGETIWAKAFGIAGDVQGGAIATNTAGNVALGGFFAGEVDFGGGAVTSNGIPADGYAVLLEP